MKGDFSRITFDAANHFSRVLLQQGRVTLDADPNEQADILLHYLRTLASDLIGPCGGPREACGFQLKPTPNEGNSSKKWTLNIAKGRYYVDGILCETDECSYADQPDYRLRPDDKDPLLVELAKPQPSTQPFWLYLDVWERHITPIEDDHIREVALGGPHTCTRSKVIWQVKALSQAKLAERNINIENIKSPDACTLPLTALPTKSSGRMAAELDPGKRIKDPCVIAPDARYRGAENQLYRVEIHRGNLAPDGTVDTRLTPTFKWSRDNGSVASVWLGTDGHDLIVASGRGFSGAPWVELSDDAADLRGEAGTLVRLISVDGNRLSIDPKFQDAIAWKASLQHPKVRRWDQAESDGITLDEGAIRIVEGTATDPHWIDLEDGLRVRFGNEGAPTITATTTAATTTADSRIAVSKIAGHYRTGDFWLIPARVTGEGEIEWPRTDSNADLRPPHGVEHHYAPLGWLTWDTGKSVWGVTSCLCQFDKLGQCGPR